MNINKLKKIGRAKARNGTKIDIVSLKGSAELYNEAGKRIGHGKFYSDEGTLKKGKWEANFFGNSENRIYALTREDRKKWNEWEEPEPEPAKREVDLTPIKHQLVRLEPETLKKFIDNVENPEVFLLCQDDWDLTTPLSIIAWSQTTECHDYWCKISNAIRHNQPHSDLLPPPVKWITDRAPTAEDADEECLIAHPWRSKSGYGREEYEVWHFQAGAPWARVEDVKHHNAEYPAPHPHGNI